MCILIHKLLKPIKLHTNKVVIAKNTKIKDIDSKKKISLEQIKIHS